MRLTQTLLKYEFRYFKRFVEDRMNDGIIRRVFNPVYGWKDLNKKTSWYYDEHRPWTDQFKNDNKPGQMKKPVPIQPIKEWMVFKGDRVG